MIPWFEDSLKLQLPTVVAALVTVLGAAGCAKMLMTALSAPSRKPSDKSNKPLDSDKTDKEATKKPSLFVKPGKFCPNLVASNATPCASDSFMNIMPSRFEEESGIYVNWSVNNPGPMNPSANMCINPGMLTNPGLDTSAANSHGSQSSFETPLCMDAMDPAMPFSDKVPAMDFFDMMDLPFEPTSNLRLDNSMGPKRSSTDRPSFSNYMAQRPSVSSISSGPISPPDYSPPMKHRQLSTASTRVQEQMKAPRLNMEFSQYSGFNYRHQNHNQHMQTLEPLQLQLQQQQQIELQQRQLQHHLINHQQQQQQHQQQMSMQVQQQQQPHPQQQQQIYEDEIDSLFPEVAASLAGSSRTSSFSEHDLETILEAAQAVSNEASSVSEIMSMPSSSASAYSSVSSSPFTCDEKESRYHASSPEFSDKNAAQARSLPVSKPACEEYKCDVCDATFRIKGYLTRHVKKHAEVKAYQCPFYVDHDDRKCHPTGGFSRRDTYKTHLKSRHFVYPSKIPSAKRANVAGHCGGCYKEFESSEVWVEQHIQTSECSSLESAQPKPEFFVEPLPVTKTHQQSLVFC